MEGSSELIKHDIALYFNLRFLEFVVSTRITRCDILTCPAIAGAAGTFGKCQSCSYRHCFPVRANCGHHPDNLWMAQIARNITDVSNGFLRRKRCLSLDRDTKYCDAFCGILTREGIEAISLPPRLSSLNTFAVRVACSNKEECLSRMIFVGQASLRQRSHSTSVTTTASEIIRGSETVCCGP